MEQNIDEITDPLNLPTRLHMDDLIGRADNPPKNLVPRKKQSLGYIRAKNERGRFYYYWVRSVYRGKDLTPSQETIMYIGNTLPHGVRIGKVDKKMADILTKIASAKNRGSSRA